MITIGSNGQKIAYGIKHFNLDTEDDLKALEKRNELMGSTCFVIETSKYYMLNSKKQWIEITPFGNAVIEDITPDIPSEDDEIIYEGGVI